MTLMWSSQMRGSLTPSPCRPIQSLLLSHHPSHSTLQHHATDVPPFRVFARTVPFSSFGSHFFLEAISVHPDSLLCKVISCFGLPETEKLSRIGDLRCSNQDSPRPTGTAGHPIHLSLLLFLDTAYVCSSPRCLCCVSGCGV